MFQSLILTTTSTNPDDRLSLAADKSLIDPNSNSIDLLILSSDTAIIGIDATRSLKAFFSTTPLTSEYKVAIIPFAETLSLQAQNSLLKILEEPPPFAQIILITNSTSRLLPTIISRCRLIHHHSATPKSNAQFKPLTNFSSTPPLDRLSLADQFSKDAASAKDFTLNSIHHFRDLLKSSPSKLTLYNLTLSLYCHKLLSQNINPKLTLDHLLLNLK